MITELGLNEKFVGLHNYVDIFTRSEQLLVIRNTVVWVVLVPLVATAIGLLYAILVDKTRGEAFAKALIFLPMAISMVGASIIWKFIYDYRSANRPQIGLLNEILVKLGFEPQQFLLDPSRRRELRLPARLPMVGARTRQARDEEDVGIGGAHRPAIPRWAGRVERNAYSAACRSRPSSAARSIASRSTM